MNVLIATVYNVAMMIGLDSTENGAYHRKEEPMSFGYYAFLPSDVRTISNLLSALKLRIQALSTL